MATATAAAVRKPGVKEFNFTWVGQDKAGKVVRGEMRATGEAQVNATLRRQGIKIGQVKKQRLGRGGRITEKDITLFTRQLATMMKSACRCCRHSTRGQGAQQCGVAKLLLDVKTEVETGSSLKQAFEKDPLHFDALFCNLVGAGEQAGILDSLLDRLATYKEKILAIKSKIRSALFYPLAIIVVAFVITAVIMIFVIPAFKQVFASFGADLPAPTLIVMAISDFFVEYWYAIFFGIGAAIYAFFWTWKRSVKMQIFMDRLILRLPVFGDLVRKSAIARWTRTLATMFAAGVPLVKPSIRSRRRGETRDYVATKNIQSEVARARACVRDACTEVFPNMVAADGLARREVGLARSMLSKVADFFEAEVDDA